MKDSAGQHSSRWTKAARLLLPMDQGARDIRALDGLRALAALSIVAFHFLPPPSAMNLPPGGKSTPMLLFSDDGGPSSLFLRVSCSFSPMRARFCTPHRCRPRSVFTATCSPDSPCLSCLPGPAHSSRAHSQGNNWLALGGRLCDTYFFDSR